MSLEQWFARRSHFLATNIKLPLLQGAWLHIAESVDEFLAQTRGTCGRCTGEWRSRVGAQAWGTRHGPSWYFECLCCSAVYTIAPQASGYILHGHLALDLLVLLRTRVDLDCKLGKCCACIVCQQERLQAPYWQATGGPKPARAACGPAALLPSRLAQSTWMHGPKAKRGFLERKIRQMQSDRSEEGQSPAGLEDHTGEPEDMEEAFARFYPGSEQAQAPFCVFCSGCHVIPWPTPTRTMRPIEMLCLVCGLSFDNGRESTPQRAYRDAPKLELICDVERRPDRRACCICDRTIHLNHTRRYVAILANLCEDCEVERDMSLRADSRDPLMNQLGLVPWMRTHSCHTCSGRLAVLRSRGNLSISLCAGCGALRLIARHGLP